MCAGFDIMNSRSFDGRNRQSGTFFLCRPGVMDDAAAWHATHHDLLGSRTRLSVPVSTASLLSAIYSERQSCQVLD